MEAKGRIWKFGNDINTDEIIPARYLNTSDPDELAKHCMEDADPEFPNKIKKGDIIIAGSNFGCGSSREHAVWALLDYGFRAVIAPSFADIFFNNCFKNGVLPVVLDADTIDRLFAAVDASPGYRLSVDLPAQEISTPEQEVIPFTVDAFRKDCLIRGLDDIGLTLEHADAIRAFEAQRRMDAPWLYDNSTENNAIDN